MIRWVFVTLLLAILASLTVIGLATFIDEVVLEEDGIGTFYDEQYNVACWTYKTSIDCVFIAPEDRVTTSFKKAGE